MAKGNLLLGTAGNSVGDVVMYRREGAQVSRVRVRKIKNPKTSAQSEQRAAFSPVAKFYSPLAVVLERSFEGLSKMKSYNKFLKTNIYLARKNDWLLPKGTGFVPLPYQLSQGSLPAMNYSVDPGATELVINSVPAQTAPTTMGDLTALFEAVGISGYDVVTIILVQNDRISWEGNHVPTAIQFQGSGDDTTLAQQFPNLTFSVTEGKLSIKFKTGKTEAGAVIIARYENDKWRRSTQYLAVCRSIVEEIEQLKENAIASYGTEEHGGNALVYLDGTELAED